jgi:hypothetical protein
MNKDTKKALWSRGKSLLWRVGAMTAVMVIDFIVKNVGLFSIDPLWVTLIGLAAGEVTKWINVSLPALKAARAQ